MIDWPTIGTGLAAAATSAWGWWERRKRKRTQREQEQQSPEPDPWNGEERRRHRTALTGRKVVGLIEDDTAPMPRHWIDVVAATAAHKVNGAMSSPLLRLEALEKGQDGLRMDMKAEGASIRKSVDKLSSLLNRVIGAAFPGMPLE